MTIMNNLRERGVITSATRVLPSGYETFAELVYSDNTYYGFKMDIIKHDWPFYSVHARDAGWYETKISLVSNRVSLAKYNFEDGFVESKVDAKITFTLSSKDVSTDVDAIESKSMVANCVKISGIITLCPGIQLGATNALNGDKIIPCDIKGTDKVTMSIKYEASKGLGNLQITQV